MRYSSLIDTVKLRFHIDHKPFGPQKLQEKDGEMLPSWSSIKIYGPFGNTLEVRSSDRGRAIEIFGSINKFGNGHNLAGSEDLRALSSYAFRAAFKHPKIRVKITPDIWRRLGAGDVEVLRLDLTAHADLQDLDGVRRAQRALLMWLPFQGRDFRNYKDETLYIGWNSKVRAFKTYIKELEMRRHPPKGRNGARAMREAAGMLRLELALYPKWLIKADLRNVSDWTPQLCHQIFSDYLEKLAWNKVHLTDRGGEQDTSVNGLIRRLHELGDAVDLVGNRRWYDRHRKSVMESRGVDISVPVSIQNRIRQTYDLANLKSRIGFGQPEWAIQTGLIAMPLTELDWVNAA